MDNMDSTRGWRWGRGLNMKLKENVHYIAAWTSTGETQKGSMVLKAKDFLVSE